MAGWARVGAGMPLAHSKPTKSLMHLLGRGRACTAPQPTADQHHDVAAQQAMGQLARARGAGTATRVRPVECSCSCHGKGRSDMHRAGCRPCHIVGLQANAGTRDRTPKHMCLTDRPAPPTHPRRPAWKLITGGTDVAGPRCPRHGGSLLRTAQMLISICAAASRNVRMSDIG